MELHTSTDKKALRKLLEEDAVDVNFLNDIGDAPLHTLVRRAVSEKKWYDLMWCFLVHCNRSKFDINIKNREEGKTAMHLAIELNLIKKDPEFVGKGQQVLSLSLVESSGSVMAKGCLKKTTGYHAQKNDLDVVKALIVFDADVNCLNYSEWSPMDYAFLNHNQEMMEFLKSRDALAGSRLRELKLKGQPIPDAMPVSLREGSFTKLDLSGIEGSVTTHSGETPLEAGVVDGQRILCLDGGGCKGLIIIEVLIYIEKLTGRKIVDLFDWIVGTSTGGVIALALVYRKKTLQELKQLFFQFADEVFGTVNRYGYGCDSAKFSRILQDYYGTEMRMRDVSEPKVLISAVDCSDTDLKLVFFNNCMLADGDDKYRDALVWKVARYTSSGPVFFEPEDNYIDGGLKANNPTDFGLTWIQKMLDSQQKLINKAEQPKYACVVSVGCGKYRAVELGDFSIQKYMTLGLSTFRLYKVFDEVKNLLRLLGTASSIEEEVAESSRLRCEKQGIPFYRFSPPFPDVRISSGETDPKLLCELIFKAQCCLTTAWTMPIYRLADLLKKVEKSRIHKEGFQYW